MESGPFSASMHNSARHKKGVRVAAVAVGLWIAAGGVAHATYWNVFNIEGESTVSADIVTYATLALFGLGPAGLGAMRRRRTVN